jgi:hypothetical protein
MKIIIISIHHFMALFQASMIQGGKILCFFFNCEQLFFFFSKDERLSTTIKVDQLVIKHLSTQGMLDPRGGLHCF